MWLAGFGCITTLLLSGYALNTYQCRMRTCGLGKMVVCINPPGSDMVCSSGVPDNSCWDHQPFMHYGSALKCNQTINGNHYITDSSRPVRYVDFVGYHIDTTNFNGGCFIIVVLFTFVLAFILIVICEHVSKLHGLDICNIRRWFRHKTKWD
jgi:hypothetical protein